MPEAALRKRNGSFGKGARERRSRRGRACRISNRFAYFVGNPSNTLAVDFASVCFPNEPSGRLRWSVTIVVLFHSVYGLRPVEFDAADRFRAAGHEVITPDLYAGRRVSSIDQGFGLMEEIGWSLICERAARAIDDLPDSTVLAGISMGAGVVASLWPRRPHTRGVLLLHALADIPGNVCRNLPVQVHVADPGTRDCGPGVHLSRRWHFYTDTGLPDYDATAAGSTWQRSLAFLDAL